MKPEEVFRKLETSITDITGDKHFFYVTIEEGLNILKGIEYTKTEIIKHLTDEILDYELRLYGVQPLDENDFAKEEEINFYTNKIKEYSYLKLFFVDDIERYRTQRKHPFDLPYAGKNDYWRMSITQFWNALEEREKRTLVLMEGLEKKEQFRLNTEVKVYLNSLRSHLQDEIKIGIIIKL